MTSKIMYTCDVVDNREEYELAGQGGADGNKHYEASLCKRTAATVNGVPLGIFVGKNEYHVCHEHLQLPLIELFRRNGLLPR